MTEYSLLVGLGASLAILRVVQNVPRWQAPRWANAGLLTLLGGLIGARLMYVGLHWSYFSAHLIEAFALWLGGLSWPGAVCGGLLGFGFVSWRWKTSLAKIADGLAPMLPPLVISIWLGSWLAGFTYGGLTPRGALWGVPSPDEYGRIAARFPLQLTAALFMLIYAFWLETRKNRFASEGQKAALMMLGFALNLLLFLPLRADPAPHWGGQLVDLWAALALFVICLVIAVIAFRQFFRQEVKE